MPTYIHFAPSFFQQAVSIVIAALFLCGWLCAAMDLQPLQQIVNEAVIECLVLAKITMQEASYLCGMSESNWRRSLSGEEKRNISLVHLFVLPYRFWLHFGPMLMWMVAKKHAREIAETFTVRRSA